MFQHAYYVGWLSKMADIDPTLEKDIQDCQIFLGPKYQTGEKYTKLPQNMAITYFRLP
jgi:hypothetical protein